MTSALYDVFIWDHAAVAWHRTAAGVHKWTLRKVLRRLYETGWDTVSILVCRRN